ncbi:hypothetical protein [Streptomyces malaysiensis]
MARYTINYLTGDTETIEAERVEYDFDARLFIFHGGQHPVALVPQANVRSILHLDGEAVDS